VAEHSTLVGSLNHPPQGLYSGGVSYPMVLPASQANAYRVNDASGNLVVRYSTAGSVFEEGSDAVPWKRYLRASGTKIYLGQNANEILAARQDSLAADFKLYYEPAAAQTLPRYWWHLAYGTSASGQGLSISGPNATDDAGNTIGAGFAWSQAILLGAQTKRARFSSVERNNLSGASVLEWRDYGTGAIHGLAWASAAPSGGTATWAIGDLVLNRDATSAGQGLAGYVNTAGGTPGTFGRLWASVAGVLDFTAGDEPVTTVRLGNACDLETFFVQTSDATDAGLWFHELTAGESILAEGCVLARIPGATDSTVGYFVRVVARFDAGDPNATLVGSAITPYEDAGIAADFTVAWATSGGELQLNLSYGGTEDVDWQGWVRFTIL
jgi:hypothetical protein